MIEWLYVVSGLVFLLYLSTKLNHLLQLIASFVQDGNGAYSLAPIVGVVHYETAESVNPWYSALYAVLALVLVWGTKKIVHVTKRKNENQLYIDLKLQINTEYEEEARKIVEEEDLDAPFTDDKINMLGVTIKHRLYNEYNRYEIANRDPRIDSTSDENHLVKALEGIIDSNTGLFLLNVENQRKRQHSKSWPQHHRASPVPPGLEAPPEPPEAPPTPPEMLEIDEDDDLLGSPMDLLDGMDEDVPEAPPSPPEIPEIDEDDDLLGDPMDLLDGMDEDVPEAPPEPPVMSEPPRSCRLCGKKTNHQITHIVPLSQGGTTALDNLQLLCSRCAADKFEQRMIAYLKNQPDIAAVNQSSVVGLLLPTDTIVETIDGERYCIEIKYGEFNKCRREVEAQWANTGLSIIYTNSFGEYGHYFWSSLLDEEE